MPRMKTPNRLFDELEIGESAELRRSCTADDFLVFANASGNLNPLHLPDPEREAVGRAHADDVLVARARVEEKRDDGIVLLSATVEVEGGRTILEGEAEVEAPT